MVPKGEIGKHSTYQKGDMFVHKKHGFVVRIVAAGEWRDLRVVEVVKGIVPVTVLDRIQGGYWNKDSEFKANREYGPGLHMVYNVCSLSACFTRTGPAARVLYGDIK